MKNHTCLNLGERAYQSMPPLRETNRPENVCHKTVREIRALYFRISNCFGHETCGSEMCSKIVEFCTER